MSGRRLDMGQFLEVDAVLAGTRATPEPIYGSTAYQAVTVQNRRGGISVHLRPGTPPGTVCHESVHAALFVLQVHGVDEHEGVGEALAYLSAHIFELIRKDQSTARAAARRATVRV